MEQRRIYMDELVQAAMTSGPCHTLLHRRRRGSPGAVRQCPFSASRNNMLGFVTNFHTLSFQLVILERCGEDDPRGLQLDRRASLSFIYPTRQREENIKLNPTGLWLISQLVYLGICPQTR